MHLTPKEAMELAILEAKKGFGYVAPNPPVGCVILNSKNELLNKGFHTAFGKPHAEIEALSNLNSEQLYGAKLFVTLEPCSHFGKTSPCAKQLSKFPFSKVFVGCEDPNPLVSGNGNQRLRKSGILVELQKDFELECQNLIRTFKKNILEQKCYVAGKFAVTQDGKYLDPGLPSPQWLTNEKSLNYVHHLRNEFDAILVGWKTISTDNPKLNIRVPGVSRENKVIIIDLNKKLNHKDLEIFKVRDFKNIYFIDVLADNFKLDGQSIKVPQNFLNEDFKKFLYDIGIYSLFIEGGAKTHELALKHNFYDEFHLFTSDKTLSNKALEFHFLKDNFKLNKSLSFDKDRYEYFQKN